MSDRGRAQKSAPKYRPRHRVTPVPSTSAGTRALTVGSVALTLPAVVGGFAPATSAQASTTPTKPTKPTVPLYPTPKPAKPLSKIVDIASAYQEQDSCDPVAKPGVTAFMNLMLATFKTGVSAGIVRSCYIGAASEHKEGRAWDWHIPATTTDRAT